MFKAGELVRVMVESSPHGYHLGAVVTAHAAIATIIGAFIAILIGQYYPLHSLAPVAAGAVIVLSFLASEPARRREQPLRFGPANQVTLFRALLAASVASLMGSDPTAQMATAAAIVASIALALDGVDGWVARKTNSSSAYGAQLDMEVDSIFTLVLCFMIYDWGHAGAWVLFCGLARYVWLGVQVFVPWFRRPLLPAFRRKTACVIGVAGLALALAPWPWVNLNTVMAGISTVTLAISFGIDARWLIQHRREPLT